MLSEIYGKVVVASKVPLPNYRPDLDDKRPQREVKLFSSFFQEILLHETGDGYFSLYGPLNVGSYPIKLAKKSRRFTPRTS